MVHAAGGVSALGLRFDLDPAAPPGGVPWVPADRHLSRATERWLDKLAAHGDGLALVFARTDTRWFQRVAAEASALCFIQGRLRFHRRKGPDWDAYVAALLAYALRQVEGEKASSEGVEGD